ncbi:MAG: efflux RND transporter permease subunit, partial [Bacteroidaceae bacterium]|nr:efflux RND transporter permease subunit [Bacteroidaceae bacterium]
LVDYTGLCRERGQSAIQATVAAAKSRLRPVLMTTLTTILGMIPMAVSQGQGAAMWRPLGISVIGGLTISTFMTLLVVPVLYCMFNGVSLKRERRKHRARLQLLEYWSENKDQYIKK